MRQQPPKIRRSLVATSPDDVGRGVEAVFLWHAFATAHLIPPPPPDLLDEVIGQVVMRRRAGLMWAICTLSDIVEVIPVVLEPRHIERVLLKPGICSADTQGAACESRLSAHGSEMTAQERGDYRALGAKLARVFRAMCEKPASQQPRFSKLGGLPQRQTHYQR